MFSYILPLFVLIPLASLVLCLFMPTHKERIISGTAIAGIGLTFLLFCVYLAAWAKGGFLAHGYDGLTLFESAHYTFAFDFFFDTTSAVFFLMTCLLSLLIMIFSRFYMHRDPGFKRFYTTILFFFAGLTLIIFSGNFETLFVGWEFIGISSFFLIAFYQDRYMPIKNALKVFSVYRIADVFLLISLWYAHHVFEKNVHFADFAELVAEHGNSFAVLGVLVLVAALIKSAQFPFSYWLSRAMEGPTTSSAIFYGALSVHMGLFILLRTYPLWEGSIWLRALIIALGLLTALICTSITRVQSTIKTQIAYASITQIGIMFVELALGLHWLVLLHFVSNACLRTYQLLISPSILSYLVHHQFYYFVLPAQKIKNNFMGKIRSTLYILGIREWNMDSAMSRYVWQTLKNVGQAVRFLDNRIAYGIVFLVFLATAFISYGVTLTPILLSAITISSAVVGLLLYARAFTTKGNPLDCWNQIFLGQLFSALFLMLASGGSLNSLLLYGVGLVIAFMVGHLCLYLLNKKGDSGLLLDFHGQIYHHKIIGYAFLIAGLSFMAFPITPSFLGEELLLSTIPTEHLLNVALFGMGYVLSGITILRVFAKMFFGPHKKSYHEIAYRTS